MFRIRRVIVERSLIKENRQKLGQFSFDQPQLDDPHQIRRTHYRQIRTRTSQPSTSHFRNMNGVFISMFTPEQKREASRRHRGCWAYRLPIHFMRHIRVLFVNTEFVEEIEIDRKTLQYQNVIYIINLVGQYNVCPSLVLYTLYYLPLFS